MKIFVTFVFFFLMHAGFSQAKNFRFDDIVTIADIEKIAVFNNKGWHYVKQPKLEKIKKEIGKMTSGNNAVKVGMKQIFIWIRNKKYILDGATNGGFIEVPASIASKNFHLFGDKKPLYFKANGLNIDNY